MKLFKDSREHFDVAESNGVLDFSTLHKVWEEEFSDTYLTEFIYDRRFKVEVQQKNFKKPMEKPIVAF